MVDRGPDPGQGADLAVDSEPQPPLGRGDGRVEPLESGRGVPDEARQAGETETRGGHRREPLAPVGTSAGLRLASHLAQPGPVGRRHLLVHREKQVPCAAEREVGLATRSQVVAGGEEAIGDAGHFPLEDGLLLEGRGAERDVRFPAREIGPAGAGLAGRQSAAGPVEAVAFDAFTLLDFRQLPATAERLFPGQGLRLEELWRTRVFEYSWLRVLGGQYRDFEAVSADAFGFASAMLKLSPPAGVRREFLETLVHLSPWPEAVATVTRLRAIGLKLAFLSNFTPGMLASVSQGTGLDRLMDAPLSTDSVRSYKPAPRAYQLAVDAFRLPKERIAFVAHGGWDAAGAGWFGFPTYWINRLGVAGDELGVPPVATLSSLSPLPDLLSGGAAPPRPTD